MCGCNEKKCIKMKIFTLCVCVCRHTKGFALKPREEFQNFLRPYKIKTGQNKHHTGTYLQFAGPFPHHLFSIAGMFWGGNTDVSWVNPKFYASLGPICSKTEPISLSGTLPSDTGWVKTNGSLHQPHHVSGPTHPVHQGRYRQ